MLFVSIGPQGNDLWRGRITTPTCEHELDESPLWEKFATDCYWPKPDSPYCASIFKPVKAHFRPSAAGQTFGKQTFERLNSRAMPGFITQRPVE